MTSEPTQEIRKVKRRVAIYWLALAAFSSASIGAVFAFAGLFAKSHSVCELSSHFYVQYLLLMLVGVLALVVLRRWRLVLVFTPFLLLCLWQVVPYYIPTAGANQRPIGKLKIVQLNLNTANIHYSDVINYVRSTNADVVGFEEVGKQWSNELNDGLKDVYPYRYSKPLENNFGIALFSKIPFDAIGTRNLANYDFATIVGEIKLQGKPITIVCTHTLPPMTDNYVEVRKQQMQELARIKSNSDHRVIILGDLNCSCWNPDFRNMLNDMNGKDTQVGFGVQSSWPSFLPILATNIDHIVTTDHFTTKARSIGRYVGSDHFPVYAELELAK